MEEIERIIIPTLSRAKISRNLSYPIGAKDISRAVASAVQLPELKLAFYPPDVRLRGAHYEFLRVEYLNNSRPVQEWPISDLFGRPPEWRWGIVVHPVPRVLRHRINQYIVEAALAQIAHWLEERTELAQQGNDVLAFFYDETTEEFLPRQLTRLEPLRHRQPPRKATTPRNS